MNASNPISVPPYNWIKDAKIYNKNITLVPPEWIKENADVIVVIFTCNGIDREGILKKFYGIYESVKHANIPIEVIHVSFDDSKREMMESFHQQANWFTLMFDDPLIPVLRYLYDVSYVPYIIVLKPDGTIVSNTGIKDLEQYGKNAVISWVSSSATKKHVRKLTDEAHMYGPHWTYFNTENNEEKKKYPRRFSDHPLSKNPLLRPTPIRFNLGEKVQNESKE